MDIGARAVTGALVATELDALASAAAALPLPLPLPFADFDALFPAALPRFAGGAASSTSATVSLAFLF